MPGDAWARRAGIEGFSGNPATNGGADCTSCHFGGVAPDAALTGPALVSVGETHTYTLEISGGQGGACGFGASVAAGTLDAGPPDARLRGPDATHVRPLEADAEGRCVFHFDWTAPDFGATIGLYVSAMSVNLDGQLTGDLSRPLARAIEVVGAPRQNQAPVAVAGGPYRGYLGQPIAFDGSRSVDPDGGIETYTWDFGDGNVAGGSETLHAYASPGSGPAVARRRAGDRRRASRSCWT